MALVDGTDAGAEGEDSKSCEVGEGRRTVAVDSLDTP